MRAVVVLTSALAPVLAGCAAPPPALPTGHLEVARSFDGKHGNQTLGFVNTKAKAKVRLSAGGSAGSLALTMWDAADKQVYAGSMALHATAAPNGTLQGLTNPAGQPGDWRVVLTYTGFRGGFNLTVDAAG